MTSDAQFNRLLGAIEASDAAVGVLTEAMRVMIEARFLLVAAQAAPITEAVAVLDKGIADVRFSLNLSDEEPG